MRKLSFIIFIYLSSAVFAQSPHGDDFDMDCENCHNPESWSVEIQNIQFNHETTGLKLIGQHATIDCRVCHSTLVFAKVNKECYECHKDVHEETVGKDCSNCHQPVSWIVANINEIHQQSRFPLLGVHAAADCKQCHTGASKVNFAPLGINCIDCHKAEYISAKSPDHAASGFSTDCQECHSINSPEWSAAVFSHSFFPLTQGHQINNCFECHNIDSFAGLSQECRSCHLENYNQSINPPHLSLQFPIDCVQCHTTSPGWRPASFAIHDQYYQLLGAHATISNNCSDCHEGGYSNTPDQCFGCHNGEYNSTVNPPHASLNFSTNCEECHNQNSWTPSSFNHDGQFFPIYSGKHTGTWNACTDCHTSPNNYGIFSCIDCHEHNKQEMDNEHQGINGYSYVSESCLACHPTGSKTDGFDHANTGFSLTGAHIVLDCQQCHSAGYTGTSSECYSCHEGNYNSAPNHQSQNYPRTCEQCHSTYTWQESTFNHSETNFALTGAHTSASCDQCHENGFTGTSVICNDCHNQDFQSGLNPNHVVLGLPVDCETCHTTQPDWSPAQFTIHDNFYSLIGEHAIISSDCAGCHNGDYINTPNECNGCHRTNYEQTVNPNHINAGIDTDCESCHTPSPDWKPALFPIHDNIYPLLGAHATIFSDCAACHNGNYNSTPSQCIGCHETDYNNTANPVHSSAGFSTNCEECHTTVEWIPSTFDHDVSYFPIYTGKHAQQWNNCIDCHIYPQNFSLFECINCHEHDKAGTDEEHTEVNGYIYASAECFACHPDGTSDGSFNHANSNFPLTGAHSALACQQCHQSGYSGTSSECVSCHADNFNSTQNPNHNSIGLNTFCQNCHTTSAWIPSTFNHAATGFELLGQHISVQCSSCHQGTTSGTPVDCYACHQDNYAAAPEHISKKYPTRCELCHTPAGWDQTFFDHATTEFPLTGAHINLNCDQCHSAGYSGTAKECFSCHIENYNNSQNPNHAAAGLSSSCEQCHNTAAWIPSTFNHTSTGFELTGQHAAIQCSDCHQGSVTNTPTQCYSCHQDNYTNAANHLAQGYPTDCSMCHNTIAWNQTTFDHSATNFPLTGAHINTNCNQCHVSGFTGTPNVCSSCHIEAYNSSANPSHTLLVLPVSCEQCHTTNPGWAPATFPIHDQYYTLIGAHSVISNNCVACHNGNYNNTPNTCFGCHQADYNSTNNPPHASAGFPEDCEACHTQNAWIPSTFDHDGQYFPIYSGRHAGEWNLCSDCHINSGNFEIFSCINCHEHNRQDMDDEHQGITGYSYNSNACYDCHPTGEADKGVKIQEQKFELR